MLHIGTTVSAGVETLLKVLPVPLSFTWLWCIVFNVFSRNLEKCSLLYCTMVLKLHWSIVTTCFAGKVDPPSIYIGLKWGADELKSPVSLHSPVCLEALWWYSKAAKSAEDTWMSYLFLTEVPQLGKKQLSVAWLTWSQDAFFVYCKNRLQIPDQTEPWKIKPQNVKIAIFNILTAWDHAQFASTQCWFTLGEQNPCNFRAHRFSMPFICFGFY